MRLLFPAVGWRTWLGLFWWDGGGAILFYSLPKPVYRVRWNSHGIWYYIPTIANWSKHIRVSKLISYRRNIRSEQNQSLDHLFINVGTGALSAFSLAHFLWCKILWMEDKCCRRLTAVVLCFSSSFWQQQIRHGQVTLKVLLYSMHLLKWCLLQSGLVTSKTRSALTFASLAQAARAFN